MPLTQTPVAGAPNDPLAGLRDIRLPAAVEWWPPAPGWWLLAAAGLALLGLLGWYAYRRYARGRARRAALREWLDLRRRYRQNPAEAAPVVAELATLLRRLALTTPAGAVAVGLSGAAWLEFLDRSGGGNGFSQGPGRLLQHLPYARPAPIAAAEMETLLELAHAWIRRQ